MVKFNRTSEQTKVEFEAEYGYAGGRAMHAVGIKKPKHMRHVTRAILKELGPTGGGLSSHETRAPGYVR